MMMLRFKLRIIFYLAVAVAQYYDFELHRRHRRATRQPRPQDIFPDTTAIVVSRRPASLRTHIL